jgi:hypothetical protein
VVATASLTLSPLTQVQRSVDQLFVLSDRNIGAFTVKVQATSPELFTYASVVDNASGDPIFIPGH